MPKIRRVPSYTRRSPSGGIVKVQAYTATTLLQVRDATRKHTQTKQGRSAIMALNAEIRRRIRLGNSNAAAIRNKASILF